MNKYQHVELIQTFEFEGTRIVFNLSKWVSQPQREHYLIVKVYTDSSSEGKAEVTGTAADFIIKKFKESELYSKVLTISDLLGK